MWKSIGLAAALGFVVVASAAGAAENSAPPHHNGHVRHGARRIPRAESRLPTGGQGARTFVEPSPRAGPPGPKADDDQGLSRDPDNCNMGCIGGNPD